MEDKDFDILTEKFIEHMRAVNPRGGFRVFLRMAIEFGYKAAKGRD